MAESNFGQLLVAALGGGFTVKMLDIIYLEYRRWTEKSSAAVAFVDLHLDPLLKAADELVGKLRSLGERNFNSLIDVDPYKEGLLNNDFASVIFLIGCFWGQIEVIRREGMSVAMSKDERGRKLQSFFDCLESRRVRIVDRITQRAIGEVFLDEDHRTITFVHFANSFENEERARRWVLPLAQFLARVKHTTERQKLLSYGTVVHALIDTLDPDHQVTRKRPWLPAKLSKRSWTALRYRVFGVYLNFVPNKVKYRGPPKRRPHNEKGNVRRL